MNRWCGRRYPKKYEGRCALLSLTHSLVRLPCSGRLSPDYFLSPACLAKTESHCLNTLCGADSTPDGKKMPLTVVFVVQTIAKMRREHAKRTHPHKNTRTKKCLRRLLRTFLRSYNVLHLIPLALSLTKKTRNRNKKRTLFRRLRFQPLRFCGTLLLAEDKVQLKALSKKCGGVMATRKWDPATSTHLVTPPSPTSVTEKLVLAVLAVKPAVHMGWLRALVEAGTAKPLKPVSKVSIVAMLAWRCNM